MTENETTFERYILSKMDKTTSGEGSNAEDTYTVKYYQLLKKAENSYELTELTCTQQTMLGDYTNPSFTLVTKKITVEKPSDIYAGFRYGTDPTTKNGEKNDSALGKCGVHADDYEHVGRHGQHDCRQNKTAAARTAKRTAPTAGLYAITTTPRPAV